MKQVLIYGDSLSWGLIPGTRKRLSFVQRWPGVFEQSQLVAGHSIRVVENCINGRRTVWEDPFKAGRNGSNGLAQVIEMHSPLSLVIMMLGVNDFQSTHANTAALSALGSARLIEIIREAPLEPGMPVPEILVVAPPLLGKPKGEIEDKFSGAVKRSHGLTGALQTMASKQADYFFDGSSVVHTSECDGVHMDADQHLILGETLAQYVSKSIWSCAK